MKRYIFNALILVLLFSCKEPTRTSQSKKTNIPFTKEGEAFITLSDTVIKIDIEMAKTEYETTTGLMYRNNMKEDRGMLFFMGKERILSFWNKNTRIALDYIYIGKDKKVVSIAKNIKPFQTENIPPSKAPAMYVLELNAGLSDKWGIKKGTQIDWKENSK